MRGTLLRHPHNGTLVYSPDTWVDPAYAITEGRETEFTLATQDQAAGFPSVPEHPGSYEEA